MFFNKQIFASVLLAIAMTSVSAAPSQQMAGAVAERDIAIEGLRGGDFHLANGDVDLQHSLQQRQMGGDAYTGASGMTNGGDAITSQRNGLLNLKAANFGGNGGRAGQSTTGGATGGNGGNVVAAQNPAPAPQQQNPAPAQQHNNPAPAAAPAAAHATPMAAAPMAGTGGDAYTGASGNAVGGNAITQQQGLINADLLNFGGNGGRGGMSGSGAAQGGHGGSIL